MCEVFGKDTPDGLTGESLEASALPGLVSRNGAGVGLDELIGRHGERLVGRHNPFPLLLKLLDARDRLSVQVHPDDKYAAACEGGKRGKTEAWVVIAAKPGAKLIYGLSSLGVAGLREALTSPNAAERVPECLNNVAVKPGDVFYIPAGTVHAVGAGMLLYEIQQSSDLTYRLWDWERVDERGMPRELHIKKALDVIEDRAGVAPIGPVKGVTLPYGQGSRTVYISNEYFTLERLSVSGSVHHEPDGGTFALLTALDAGEMRWQGGLLAFKAGDTVFVPACFDGFDIIGNCDILKSYLTEFTGG